MAHYKVTILCGRGYHDDDGVVGTEEHIVLWEGDTPWHNTAICGRKPGQWSYGWDQAVRYDLREPWKSLCKKCRRAVKKQPKGSTVE